MPELEAKWNEFVIPIYRTLHFYQAEFQYCKGQT